VRGKGSIPPFPLERKDNLMISVLLTLMAGILTLIIVGCLMFFFWSLVRINYKKEEDDE
jgi:hypothetical protein